MTESYLVKIMEAQNARLRFQAKLYKDTMIRLCKRLKVIEWLLCRQLGEDDLERKSRFIDKAIELLQESQYMEYLEVLDESHEN